MKRLITTLYAAIAALPLFSSNAALAESVNRTPVSDIRELLVAAIDAADGEAHGVLAGEMADTISKHFKTTSPLYVDVTTERRFEQPGCSRLKVLIRQDGVILPGTSVPKSQKFEIGINYCRNGLPPASRT